MTIILFGDICKLTILVMKLTLVKEITNFSIPIMDEYANDPL